MVYFGFGCDAVHANLEMVQLRNPIEIRLTNERMSLTNSPLCVCVCLFFFFVCRPCCSHVMTELKTLRPLITFLLKWMNIETMSHMAKMLI